MMRYRKRLDSVTSKTAREIWYRYGGVAFDNTVPYDNTREIEHMFDVSTKSFKKLRNKGNLIYNPMYRERVRENVTLPIIDAKAYIYARCDYGTLVCRNTPIVSGALLNKDVTCPTYWFDKYFDDNFANERNSAVTAAWANVDQTQLLIGATVGELPETIEWLCNCFRRVNSFLKMGHTRGSFTKALKRAQKVRLKKGHLKTDLSTTGNLLDFWMETRYALRPFLYEISNAVDALNKSLLAGQRFTARGFTTKNLDKTESVLWSYDAYTGANASSTIAGTYQARAGVFYALGAAFDKLQLILGLDRPLATFYELTKLSYAVDWFLNIGQFIASWEKNASFSVLGSWVTETVSLIQVISTTSTYCNWGAFGYTGIEASVAQPGYMERNVHMVRRTIEPSRPIHPSVRINLDWMKLIDLVAITKGLLKVRMTASK